MTLQSSGAISLGDIRTELGLSGAISLNDSLVRTLLGKSSGIIALSDAYGKGAYATAPGVPYYTNITQTSITINWSASSNVSYYEVYYWNGSIWVWLENSSTTYAGSTGLTPGATYYFWIRAISAVGYGTWGSNYAGVTTQSAGSTIPGTPTYTNIGRTSLTVNWTGVTGTIDNYYIYIWTGTAWNFIAFTAPGVLSWTHPSLAPNTTYWFYIAAVTGTTQVNSSSSSVTTLP
jgi:predicted phage tail protein